MFMLLQRYNFRHSVDERKGNLLLAQGNALSCGKGVNSPFQGDCRTSRIPRALPWADISLALQAALHN